MACFSNSFLYSKYIRIIFLKQHSFKTKFSVPSLPMYLLHMYREEGNAFPRVHSRVFIPFLCTQMYRCFLSSLLVRFLFCFVGFFFNLFLSIFFMRKYCQALCIVHFFLNRCYFLLVVLRNNL